MTQPKHPIFQHIRWLLPLLFLAIAIMAFIGLRASKPQAPSKPVTEKVWSVQTVAARPDSHSPVLELYGQVESPRLTTLTAAVTAYVDQVPTDEGRNVTDGETLIQLDQRDARLVLQQREAEVLNYQAQLDAEQVRHQTDLKSLKIQQSLLQINNRSVQRYLDLEKRKVASQDQLDNARSAYQQQALSLATLEQAITDHPNRVKQIEAKLQSAIAQRDAARLDLERTRITAPFAGRVVSLQVAPGDRVTPGNALLTLYSQSRLEVRAQVPSRFLPGLRQADSSQRVTASARLDDQPLTLVLDRFAAAVGDGKAGIDAMFQIQSNGLLPEPGRSLSLKLQLPAVTNSISLPPTALYGLDRVYKVVDERLQAVSVTRIGDSINRQGEPRILISSDQLQPGDRILITQLPNAITGLRVKEVDSDV